jgi:hypothetical protein
MHVWQAIGVPLGARRIAVVDRVALTLVPMLLIGPSA